MQLRKMSNLNVVQEMVLQVPRFFGTKEGWCNENKNYFTHTHFSSAGACPPGWPGVALADQSCQSTCSTSGHRWHIKS